MKPPRPRTGRSRTRPADATPTVASTVAPTDALDTPVPLPGAPSADVIRARAYELYVARGRSPGAELDDWLTAERALHAAPDAGDGPSEASPAP